MKKLHKKSTIRSKKHLKNYLKAKPWAKCLLCICLAAGLMLSLGACSAKEEKDVSLYDLNKAMSEVCSFGEMEYVSSADENAESNFKYISKMDYSKVSGFFINYAADGAGNADEIACITVKSRKDLNEAVLSLQAHLKTRTGLYETYDTSQLGKLSDAVIASYGNTAVLIVSDNADKAEKAFYDYFR